MPVLFSLPSEATILAAKADSIGKTAIDKIKAANDAKSALTAKASELLAQKEVIQQKLLGLTRLDAINVDKYKKQLESVVAAETSILAAKAKAIVPPMPALPQLPTMPSISFTLPELSIPELPI